MILARSGNIIQYNPNLDVGNESETTFGQYNKRFTPWEFCPLMVFESPLNPKHLSALALQEDGSFIHSKLRHLGVEFNTVVYTAHYIKGKTKQHGFCYDVYEPKSRYYVRVYQRVEVVCKKLRKDEVPDIKFTVSDEQSRLLGIPDKIDRITDEYNRFIKAKKAL